MVAFFLLFLCLLGLRESALLWTPYVSRLKLLRVEDGGPGTDYQRRWPCGAQIPGANSSAAEYPPTPSAIRSLPLSPSPAGFWQMPWMCSQVMPVPPPSPQQPILWPGAPCCTILDWVEWSGVGGVHISTGCRWDASSSMIQFFQQMVPHACRMKSHGPEV